MQYTSHVKASHLKSLIQQNTDCESKLRSIEKLLGIPPTTSETTDQGGVSRPVSAEQDGGGQTENVVRDEQQLELDRRERSQNRIFADLTGKDLRLAKSLLQRIETATGISYDYESLEIIINNERLLHSSIKSLIEKIVNVSSPQLPIGFTRFINALIDSKVPVQYIQNSDALNVRLGLLSIKKAKQEGVLTPSIVSEERNEGQVGVAETIRGGGGQDETTVGVGSETGGETFVSRKRALEIEASKKRSREIDSDDEGELRPSKTVKINKPVETELGTSGETGEEVLVRQKRSRETDSEDEGELKPSKTLKITQPETKSKKGATKAKTKAKKTPKEATPGVRKSKRLALKEDLEKDWSPI